MTERKVDIGIVGVSGAVGADLLRLMRGATFPVGNLKLFGAAHSAGDVHEYDGKHHVVRPYKTEALADLDLVVAVTPPAVSRRVVGEAVAAGVFAVDASAAFRGAEDIPLVVPSVNGYALPDASGIVASPGALAIALSYVLAPLVGRDGERGPGVAAVDATAMLACSALGREGMNEMSRQVVSILNQRPFETERFPRQLAFNVVPWFDGTPDGGPDRGPVEWPEAGALHGSSVEEWRTAAELRRLLPGLPAEVGVTVALAPVFVGHSVSLTVTLDEALPVTAVAGLLAGAPGIDLRDDTGAADVPASVDAAEMDELVVARLRVDPAQPRTVRLWLTFDNLRTAARNLLLLLDAVVAEGLV